MQRVDQLRVRVAFGQLDQLPQDVAHDEAQGSSFRPPDPQRVEWQPGLRFTLDVRAGEHVGPAVRTRRRPRQPHVDDELRLTAKATPPPPSPDAPETPPADAPPAAAAHSPLFRQTLDVVRPRHRLEPAEDIAGVQRPAVRLDRRDDAPLRWWNRSAVAAAVTASRIASLAPVTTVV